MNECSRCQYENQCIQHNLHKMTYESGCPNYKVRAKLNVDVVRGMPVGLLADLFNKIESDGKAYGPRGRAAWLKYLTTEVDSGHQ